VIAKTNKGRHSDSETIFFCSDGGRREIQISFAKFSD